jgi:hypothetical protein
LASATEETRRRRRRRRSSSNAKPGCKRDLSAMAIKRHHLSTQQHATSFETPNNRKCKFILLKKKHKPRNFSCNERSKQERQRDRKLKITGSNKGKKKWHQQQRQAKSRDNKCGKQNKREEEKGQN